MEKLGFFVCFVWNIEVTPCEEKASESVEERKPWKFLADVLPDEEDRSTHRVLP